MWTYYHRLDAMALKMDIDHAIRHATVVEEVADDPVRFLVIGPDRSANLLE